MARTKEGQKPRYDRQNKAWRARINGKRLNLFKVDYGTDPIPTEPPQEAWQEFHRLQESVGSQKNDGGETKPSQPVKSTDSPTLKDYAADYLKSVNHAQTNENTVKARTYAVGYLLEFAEEAGIVYLADFGLVQARGLVAFLRAKHQPSTVKTHLKNIAPLFKLAIEDGVYKLANPIASVVGKVKVPKANPTSPDKHYTPEETALITERLREYVKKKPKKRWLLDYFVIASSTGMRVESILAVSCSWLKKSENGIDYLQIPDEHAKGGHGYSVFCPPAVKEIVQAADDRVFPHLNGSYQPYDALARFFQHEAKTDARFAEFAQRKRFNHINRHAFLMRAVNTPGVSIAAVSKNAGHSCVRVTEIYAQSTRDNMLNEMSRLFP